MHDNLRGMANLANYGNRLDQLIAQLMSLFPEVDNVFSWREAIFSAQGRYKSATPKLADPQLFVADRWLQHAKDGCLEVKMDPTQGLVVREVSSSSSPRPSQPSEGMRKRMKKLLFNLLDELPDDRLLQIYEIQAEFRRTTGESLETYVRDLEKVIDELHENLYLCYHKPPNNGGTHRFSKGSDFDIWKAEMTVSPQTPTTISTTHITFNAPIGVAQTGAHSTAYVQHSTDPNQLQVLKTTLETVLAELAKSTNPAEPREEEQEQIKSAIAEINKPKPNRLLLRTILGGIATTVQTLGASSAAYQAAKEAFTSFGISFP